MAVAELARSLQDDFLQIFGACFAIYFEELEQTRLAELLTFWNVRFRHTVGKKQHAVAGCQVAGAGGKLLDGKYAENAAAFQQAVVRAVAMEHDWRIVARVGVTQLARRAIQQGVEKRDESVGSDIAADERIQPAAQIFRSKRRRSEASESRLQIGHQQRRGHAFSGNVTDAYAQRLLPERKDVVVVAAHHARWLPGAGNFESVQLRDLFRQKALLNRARFGDLAVLGVKLRGDFGLRDGVGRGFLASVAALAADLDLFLQNLKQAGIDPGLFDEVAHALLHRFDRQADGGPAGHHHDWRSVFGGFQSRQ